MPLFYANHHRNGLEFCFGYKIPRTIYIYTAEWQIKYFLLTLYRMKTFQKSGAQKEKKKAATARDAVAKIAPR